MSPPSTNDSSFHIGEKIPCCFFEALEVFRASGMSSASPIKMKDPPPMSRMYDTSAEVRVSRSASMNNTPKTAERAEMKLKMNACRRRTGMGVRGVNVDAGCEAQDTSRVKSKRLHRVPEHGRDLNIRRVKRVRNDHRQHLLQQGRPREGGQTNQCWGLARGGQVLSRTQTRQKSYALSRTEWLCRGINTHLHHAHTTVDERHEVG